jgi:hypothetical protein
VGKAVAVVIGTSLLLDIQSEHIVLGEDNYVCHRCLIESCIGNF